MYGCACRPKVGERRVIPKSAPALYTYPPPPLQLIIFSSFAIALVYGAFRVAAGAYTGGTVLNVLMSVLLGGFAIMQGAPTIQYLIKVCVRGRGGEGVLVAG